MKGLKKIKNFFTLLLCCIYFAFVICMTVLLLNYNKYGVTELGDKTFVIIDGNISSEIYKKGDLTIVNKLNLDKIQVGDEIFTYQVDSNGKSSITLGTVGEIHLEEQAISYENGSTYAMEFVIGKAYKTYNKVGTYLSIIESKWGFLFIVLVPSFLIFIYEIYALIVEIKYGEEE